MTKLYKSKLASAPHVVSAYRLRDFLSARESNDETGKAYSYVCQRQECYGVKAPFSSNVEMLYRENTNYAPFIMSDDIFEEAYEEIE